MVKEPSFFDSVLNESEDQLFEARVFAHSSGFGLSGHYDYEVPKFEPTYHYLGIVHEVDADYYVDRYGDTTESLGAAQVFKSKEEALEAAKKAIIFEGSADYMKVDSSFQKIEESAGGLKTAGVGALALGAMIGTGYLSLVDEQKSAEYANEIGIEDVDYSDHGSGRMIKDIYYYKYDGLNREMTPDALCAWLKRHYKLEDISYEDLGRAYKITFTDKWRTRQGTGIYHSHKKESGLVIPKDYFEVSFVLNESDNKYKAKVAGKGWLKGNDFVDDENEADTFESKTEPTQRINQMKKDGKLDKNAKITTKTLKESTRGLETYADIINLKYDLIDEHRDVWGDNTADKMEDVVIRLGDTHGKGLAASGILKNGKIGIIISPICAAFAKEDVDNIVIHELAHCAVYFTFGSFCRKENGGHNKEWHYYVDQLNEKGFDIREIVDEDYLNGIEERMDKLQEMTSEQNADSAARAHHVYGYDSWQFEKNIHDTLKESVATKYMACCYDPEDYYETTNFIDEDGELKCNSSGAKLFDTEDEAIEYADDNKPYGWWSFAMPCNSTLDEATIPQAKRFAARKHGERNQVRKATGAPYIVHPEGVAALVKDFGGDDEQVQAAWLHDTMEDTGTWKDDLIEKFGDRVANIVAELTNDDYAIRSLGSKEDYMNQKLCHLSHDALLVKLCDMLYNHEDFPPMQQKMRIEKNIHYLMQNRELNENEWQICNKIVSGD